MRANPLIFLCLSFGGLDGCADLLGVESLSGVDAGTRDTNNVDAGSEVGNPSDAEGECVASWMDASAGVVPAGAIPNHALDDSGLAIYVCRASYGSEVVPGKLRAGWGCYFGDNDGGEVLATSYQALVPTGCTVAWKPAPDGFEPAGVLPCGQDSQGPLYSCRVTQTGMYLDELGHIGWSTNHQCEYSYATYAYTTADFDVLTLQ